MILLDTHALIWLNDGNERLGSVARARLLGLPEKSILVSAISFWEIALLVEKKRLVFDRPLDDWFDQATQFAAAEITPITRDVDIASVRLPEPFHADPADRFIVTTARLAKVPLMTADQAILAYGRLGHVDTIDAAL